MIRAVIDTNVYVAALLSNQGAPARLMSALGEGLFDAVACPHLLDELSSVLTRPKIAVHLAPGTAAEFIGWLARTAAIVPDPLAVPRVSPDPGDDYLIALAHAGRAQVVVSGDAHLLGLDISDPRVLAPAAFAAVVVGLR